MGGGWQGAGALGMILIPPGGRAAVFASLQKKASTQGRGSSWDFIQASDCLGPKKSQLSVSNCPQGQLLTRRHRTSLER